MTRLVYVLDMNIAGQKMRALRLKLGKPAEEVARSLEMSTTAMHKYETGEKIPSAERMAAIATYYQVSLEDLFFTLRRHEE